MDADSASGESVKASESEVIASEDSGKADGESGAGEPTALERTSKRYMDLMRKLLNEDPAHKGDVLMYVEVLDLNNDLSYEYSVLFREPTELLRQEIYTMDSDKPVISVPVNRYNVYYASDKYGDCVASIETKDGKTYIVNEKENKLYYIKSEDTKKEGYPWLVASEFMDRGRGELSHPKKEGAVKNVDGVPVELATDQDLAIINSIIVGGKKEPPREPVKLELDAKGAMDMPDENWKQLFDQCLASYVKAMDTNEKLFD